MTGLARVAFGAFAPAVTSKRARQRSAPFGIALGLRVLVPALFVLIERVG